MLQCYNNLLLQWVDWIKTRRIRYIMQKQTNHMFITMFDLFNKVFPETFLGHNKVGHRPNKSHHSLFKICCIYSCIENSHFSQNHIKWICLVLQDSSSNLGPDFELRSFVLCRMNNDAQVYSLIIIIFLSLSASSIVLSEILQPILSLCCTNSLERTPNIGLPLSVRSSSYLLNLPSKFNLSSACTLLYGFPFTTEN
jgi:hypothetical protein